MNLFTDDFKRKLIRTNELLNLGDNRSEEEQKEFEECVQYLCEHSEDE